MIYLFNSAYRPRYQENLLATLFLPNGWTNEYRYRHSGQRRNVSEDFTSSVKKIQGKEDAVIIFINRFGSDIDGNTIYEYYPIRNAKFLSYREEGQQLYIMVKLLDYIFPTDIDSFNQELVNELSPKNLPKLTNSNPFEENDGHYAINTNNIFADKSKFIVGDIAWDNCVAKISNTEKLKSSVDNQVIFARSRLCKHGRTEKIVNPTITNNPWYQTFFGRINNGEAFYKLVKNNKYNLWINYVYPIQEQDTTMTANINIEFVGNITPLSSQELPIDSRASRIVFSFVANEPMEGRAGKLACTCLSKIASTEIIAPKRDFSFQIGHSGGHLFALIISALLFILCSTFIGTYGTYSPEEGLLGICNVLKSEWPKIIAALVQITAIYWAFRLTGRKML